LGRPELSEHAVPLPSSRRSEKVIALNPKKSFGAPYLASRGITTAIIVSRFDAGETIRSLAKDYAVEEDEISAAIVYEQAAPIWPRSIIRLPLI
jgi:uncharacterized protein (DUF433 family)